MAGKRRYSLNSDSTKKCKTCGEFLLVSEFTWANKTRGWKQSSCKTCKAKRQMKQYYTRRKKIRKYLAKHPCVDCGNRNPVVLIFDHIRDKKSFTISSSWPMKWAEVKKEIAKCEVRCRNCHAIRHDKDGYGRNKQKTHGTTKPSKITRWQQGVLF